MYVVKPTDDLICYYDVSSQRMWSHSYLPLKCTILLGSLEPVSLEIYQDHRIGATQFTKWLPGMKTLSYHELLDKLGLESLILRQLHSDYFLCINLYLA